MSAPSAHDQVQAQARHLLTQAEVRLDPAVNPLVQLMQWSLATGQSQQEPALIGPQSETLENMATWSDREIARFLLHPPTEDNPTRDAQDLLQPGDLRGVSPAQGAQVLLGLLHDRLSRLLPDYPPPSHLQAQGPRA